MTDDKVFDELSDYSEIAEATGNVFDPYEQYDELFKEIDIDYLDVYKIQEIQAANYSRKSSMQRSRYIDMWGDHMDDFSRHPACPNTEHAMAYIEKELAKEIKDDYLNEQLRTLARMFDFWNGHSKMPHGTGEAKGYNPIRTAKRLKSNDIDKKTRSDLKKAQHPISIDEIARRLRGIKYILNRAVITTQFKYGLRGGQARNLQIAEINIHHEDIKELYPEMGTHPLVSQHDDDVMFFQPFSGRSGGKSQRPIVMPIDGELKHLLIQYLRVRPVVDKPWFFINNVSGNQLRTAYITETMWKPAFHPKYKENEWYKPVTSHYARHRFNTYWKKEKSQNIEYIKYMRGDAQGSMEKGDLGSMKEYVHTYYDDIRDIYLNEIYKFNF